MKNNTKELIKNADKANSGNGVVNPLTAQVKNDYKNFIQNNPFLKQKIEKEKEIALNLYNMDINDIPSALDKTYPPLSHEAKHRILTSLKQAKQYDDKNKLERAYENFVTDGLLANTANNLKEVPAVGATLAVIEGIKNGTIVSMVVEEVALRKIEKATGPIGDKIVEYGGKYLVKVGGKVKEIAKETYDKVKSNSKKIEVKVNPSVANPSGHGKLGYENKGFYDSNKIREHLEVKNGKENVVSTTNPKKPHQASIKKSDVVIDANGNKAVKVTLDNGLTKMIPYDNRGLPIFDDVAVFTTKIDDTKSYAGQMKQASKNMWEAIKDDSAAKSKFTDRQLGQLKAGAEKIKGYTWHHNAQSSPNNMQLVPTNIHSIPHTGQSSIKKGK